eukprot:TRINITY_DN14164_c0_g1_i3.p1 TRINITY_DN14164_c0_g1~~TRINITY_DN14164_c0_g1_i3.p1  ORF type:complete len:552 (+),score=137.66 TRINITY_DN14164_c0_g1_i3:31-1686(+)
MMLVPFSSSMSFFPQKFMGVDLDFMNWPEEHILERLAESYRRLMSDGGQIKPRKEGSCACSQLLSSLEAAARALRLEKASRSYRSSFTVNYKTLFPDEARRYCVDVLAASADWNAVIWVNGVRYVFSDEAMRLAAAMEVAWQKVLTVIDRWASCQRSPLRPSRCEVRNALVALDTAWAGFEETYIGELIVIEEHARRPIQDATEKERALHFLEATHGSLQALREVPEYAEVQRDFVRCISHLNTVANVSRKGRDDLRVEVLEEARALLAKMPPVPPGAVLGPEEDVRIAARVLATEVTEAYARVRDYFREIGGCLERVDPHLCNNSGLQARLEAWEESWEVGTRYLQGNGALLGAICDVVSMLREAQRLVPALQTMCSECDVEVFFVLPRILWLQFLRASVHGRSTGLMQTLLPHRFGIAKDDASATSSEAHAELEEFVRRFKAVWELLVTASAAALPASAITSAAADMAWALLLERLIGGGDGKADVYGRLASSQRDSASAAVEEFMNELERWSIELQRHCPEEWNHCSAIILRCVRGGGKQRDEESFRV